MLHIYYSYDSVPRWVLLSSPLFQRGRNWDLEVKYISQWYVVSDKSILVSIISLTFNYEYLCLLSCYLLHSHQTILNVLFGEGALVSSKSRVSNTKDNSSVSPVAALQGSGRCMRYLRFRVRRNIEGTCEWRKNSGSPQEHWDAIWDQWPFAGNQVHVPDHPHGSITLQLMLLSEAPIFQLETKEWQKTPVLT